MSWCATRRWPTRFIAPAFFLLLFLVAYPFALSVWLSLSDARIGETGSFVGLENFQRLLTQLDLSPDAAELHRLHRGGARGQDGLRDGAGAPAVPHRTIQAPDSRRGAVAVHRAHRAEHAGVVVDVRAALQRRELDPQSLHIVNRDIPWLSDPYLAMFTVILVNTWRGLPFFAITILAGLVAIPRELYEAAESDGAGPIGRFWHVTVPLLKPVLGGGHPVLRDLHAGRLQHRLRPDQGRADEHDAPLRHVLVRPRPAGRTDLAGAAVSLFLFPILLIVVFVQLRMVRRATTYE